MAKLLLRRYQKANLLERSNATNLFWVLVLMMISSLALFALALARSGVSQSFLPWALLIHMTICGIALVLLLLGQLRISRWVGYSSLLILFTLSALFSRTGVTEMDLFRAISYYFFGFMILSVIGAGGIQALIWVVVGSAALAAIWLVPADGFLVHSSIAEWNAAVNPITPVVIYLSGALAATIQVIQTRRNLKMMQWDQEIIEASNQALEQTVEDRTRALRTILDSSGQGLFTFGADFKVEPDYSNGCRTLFGQEIAGLEADRLLFPQGSDMTAEFRQGLTLYFEGKSRSSVIFDLLEKETYIRGRFLEVDYREAGADKILVVLTDVTLDRQLSDRNRADEARRTLVLKALGHKHFFAGLLHDADTLFGTLRIYEDRPATTAESESLLAGMHTFKGNCGFFGFTLTQEVAHDFEFAISDSLVLEQDLDYHDLSLDLKRAYYQELGVISEVLGQDWLEEAGGIVVPRDVYDKVVRYMAKKFAGETHLVDVMEHFRKLPLKDLFSRFPFIAQATAEKLGKRITTMEITGGELRVVPERIDTLVSSCVHIVNNMVDHGIELPYVREAQGKPMDGRLTLNIIREASSVVFQFVDDGQGVSLPEIEARARSLGILAPEDTPSPRDLLQLLFTSGFSTRTEATEVSGRGVGLAAVRQEAERLGGRVEVSTKLNAGTTFEIILPLGVFANRRSAGPPPGPERRKE